MSMPNINAIADELRAKLARARELINSAFHARTITSEQRQQYLAELTPADEAGVVVTITTLLRNPSGAQARTDLGVRVEGVLSGLARQVGGEIVPNSTQVTIGGSETGGSAEVDQHIEDDDLDDDEDFEDDDEDEEGGVGGDTRALTIDAQLASGAYRLDGNYSATNMVGRALGDLGRQYGISVQDVSLHAHGRQDIQVRLTAVGGNGTLGSTAQVNTAVERVLSSLASDNGLELISGSVRVS